MMERYFSLIPQQPLVARAIHSIYSCSAVVLRLKNVDEDDWKVLLLVCLCATFGVLAI